MNDLVTLIRDHGLAGKRISIKDIVELPGAIAVLAAAMRRDPAELSPRTAGIWLADHATRFDGLTSQRSRNQRWYRVAPVVQLVPREPDPPPAEVVQPVPVRGQRLRDAESAADVRARVSAVEARIKQQEREYDSIMQLPRGDPARIAYFENLRREQEIRDSGIVAVPPEPIPPPETVTDPTTARRLALLVQLEAATPNAGWRLEYIERIEKHGGRFMGPSDIGRRPSAYPMLPDAPREEFRSTTPRLQSAIRTASWDLMR